MLCTSGPLWNNPGRLFFAQFGFSPPMQSDCDFIPQRMETLGRHVARCPKFVGPPPLLLARLAVFYSRQHNTLRDLLASKPFVYTSSAEFNGCSDPSLASAFRLPLPDLGEALVFKRMPPTFFHCVFPKGALIPLLLCGPIRPSCECSFLISCLSFQPSLRHNTSKMSCGIFILFFFLL